MQERHCRCELVSMLTFCLKAPCSAPHGYWHGCRLSVSLKIQTLPTTDPHLSSFTSVGSPTSCNLAPGWLSCLETFTQLPPMITSVFNVSTIYPSHCLFVRMADKKNSFISRKCEVKAERLLAMEQIPLLCKMGNYDKTLSVTIVWAWHLGRHMGCFYCRYRSRFQI